MTHDHEVLGRRRAGVLLHLTSLPGPSASGDLGEEAHRFLEFLGRAGATVWQMLPLGPPGLGNSPYQCISAFAGNPALISLARLQDWGWVHETPDPRRSDIEYRRSVLRGTADRVLKAKVSVRHAFEEFCQSQAFWLDDYCLFVALRHDSGGRGWADWSPELRDRDPKALARARSRLAPILDYIRFGQFVFARQWAELRAAAQARGILLFGDMPIFVAYDSAEVWAYREFFKLDDAGRPNVVAGVPPDYFSEDGQRWGNPLYDWDRIRADGFSWWLRRLGIEFDRFDLVRVDHFRGFEACWEIPGESPTARSGLWAPVPGAEFFAAARDHFGRLPLVAEDLGIITDDVRALRQQFGLPGMCIMQFAFDGGEDNPYRLERHEPECVVYTGTHDNDTTLSWYQLLPGHSQERVQSLLNGSDLSAPMPWPLIEATMGSVARLAVVPMQDILGLGTGHRMNTPGTPDGNWGWRFTHEQVADDVAHRFCALAERYGRV